MLVAFGNLLARLSVSSGILNDDIFFFPKYFLTPLIAKELVILASPGMVHILSVSSMLSCRHCVKVV